VDGALVGASWFTVAKKAYAVFGCLHSLDRISFRCCVSQALSESRLRWFAAAGYRYGIDMSKHKNLPAVTYLPASCMWLLSLQLHLQHLVLIIVVVASLTSVEWSLLTSSRHIKSRVLKLFRYHLELEVLSGFQSFLDRWGVDPLS
jgi:hypothetical protein